MTNKLVILRHGESIWNFENKFTGWTDVELTKNGMHEAIFAGKQLAEYGFEFDIAYTSLLKRAIDTLKLCLDEVQSKKVNVIKDWRLNERHYGSLQGLNKKETSKKYGEKQVMEWRRSYDIAPPQLSIKNMNHPIHNPMYVNIEKSNLPSSESLKNVKDRFIPLWKNEISKKIKQGKKIIIVAHGNSLRALVKHLNNISNIDIIKFNIPTGVPMVFEFDKNMEPLKNFYLGDSKKINEKINNVINQGSIN